MSRRLSSATIEDSDDNNTVLVAGTTVTFARARKEPPRGHLTMVPQAPSRRRHPTFIAHPWLILDRRSTGSATKQPFKTV
jgi:hypothetical protein